MSDDIITAQGIVKDFPGTRALDHVDFHVRRGEVHALVGENGAGKSTLVKVICGALRADGGTIRVGGVLINIKRPRDAFQYNIATMYQEFNLLPDMSVVDNLFLGRELVGSVGFLRRKEMLDRASRICGQVGLHGDLNRPVAALSTAEKQLLEIAKGLAYEAKTIFMDEPTAVLTDLETQRLFHLIRTLKAQSIAVVYISHRLDEIFQIADTVTVLKDGKHVVTDSIESFADKAQIVRHMIGRDLLQEDSSDDAGRRAGLNEKVLSVFALCGGKVDPVSFDLHRGEILGFAGLVGSGRSEIMRLIFGADPKRSGRTEIGGKTVDIRSPLVAIRNGIGFVPEDRGTQGVILGWNVRMNLSLAALRWVTRLGLVRIAKEKAMCRDYIGKLQVKVSSLKTLIEHLSGGNQQKAIIAKWLATRSRIMIFDEPTRGIDVGSRAEIHRLIKELAREGIAAIVVSSDLPEIISMSDRVLVVRSGRIVAELRGDEINEETIMLNATGQAGEGVAGEAAHSRE